MEAKLDAVLRSVDREKAERIIAEIDEAYSGGHTDIPHGHR